MLKVRYQVYNFLSPGTSAIPEKLSTPSGCVPSSAVERTESTKMSGRGHQLQKYHANVPESSGMHYNWIS